MYKREAKKFLSTFPYHNQPYCKRNWGHSWHSLCSYRGRLKPSIAHFLVTEFTSPNDIVLDPLCGVGTIPFEACINGRVGIGNDLSEFAYIITKPKLQKPRLCDCMIIVSKLGEYIENKVDSEVIDECYEKYKNFGLVGKIEEYFEEMTLREILCARRFFSAIPMKKLTSAEAMVFACLLHVLQGNRPYALSRLTNARVAFRPKGEFIYKEVIRHIENKLMLSYDKGVFDNYTEGKTYFGDYRHLIKENIKANAIITSPPFADSFSFQKQNWLRLWLCGWEEENFKNVNNNFLDKAQHNNLDVYYEFFDICNELLYPKGKLILHLGKTKKIDMAEELLLRSKRLFNLEAIGNEETDGIEDYGIRDNGRTVKHQFLFLTKK